MYWIEQANNLNEITYLNNNQIAENISYMERKYEYLYCRELRKLEKKKAEAIIRNLEEFQIVEEKYQNLKRTSPENWFENWEAYKAMMEEARKRKIEVKKEEKIAAETMLVFG